MILKKWEVEQQKEFYLDKAHSNIMKGIAIILMIITHMWARNDWYLKQNTYIGFKVGNTYIEEYIAHFAGIVVSIFIFITGYAMYINKDLYRNFKYRIRRCLHLLINYWIIVGLFLLIGFVLKEKLPTIDILVLNLFGLDTGPNAAYINVCFAWYIRFYLASLLLYPIYIKLSRYNFIVDMLITIILFTLLKNVYYKTSISNLSVMGPLFFSIAVYTPILMLGYSIAKYRVFERSKEYLDRFNIDNMFLYIITILIISIARVKIDALLLDIIYTPLFIFSIICLSNKWKSSEKAIHLKRIFDKTLIYLSKHSINIWFLHAIFFTPKRQLQWIAFVPKLSILIVIWIIIILLPISCVITIIQKKCLKLLRI